MVLARRRKSGEASDNPVAASKRLLSYCAFSRASVAVSPMRCPAAGDTPTFTVPIVRLKPSRSEL